MEKGKNNAVLLTVIGIATLLVAVIGATFAYFSARVTTNDTSHVVIKAASDGTVVTATGGDDVALNTDGIYPRSEAWLTKEVSLQSDLVQNNGSWTFTLHVTKNTFERAGLATGDTVDFDDLVYKFTKQSDSYGLADNHGSDETAMLATGGEAVIGYGTVVPHNTSSDAKPQGFYAHYIFEIFFKNDTNRNQNYADYATRELNCYITMDYKTDAISN